MGIPVVFAFNDTYAAPAAIAIKSLVHKGGKDTEYDIYIITSSLSVENRRAIERIARVAWLDAGEIFRYCPVTEEYPVDVYARLAIPSLLPQYDKIIYSDVDVLFRTDLSELYGLDMVGYDWAGVPVEKNVDHTYLCGGGMSGHQKFAENTNECIFATGLMLINAKRWRENHLLDRALEAVDYYGDRLKMFDLDVLNNICQGSIRPLSLRWCAFEDLVSARRVSDTALYPFLAEIYSKQEIEEAAAQPAIIHYTGVNSIRVRDRELTSCPAIYRYYKRLEVTRCGRAARTGR